MSRRNFIPRSATISSGLLDLLSHSALPKYGCLRSRRLAFPYRRSFFGNPRYASSTSTESLPRVAQPALWRPLIPKFLRRTQPSAASTAQAAKSRPSKEWNPATFYIVIFILIGSQAVQIIAIRNELNTYTRKADAKISLLKDVIERVQRGEDVDVEGLLGTGDKEKENEWEEGKFTRRL
ncbi:hypothetical protein MMC16_002303 [Acarospora aff. strigata]|nr:hypothetical protein [Acarospora aff. strigata]